jgi:hypothetical protein
VDPQGQTTDVGDAKLDLPASSGELATIPPLDEEGTG